MSLSSLIVQRAVASMRQVEEALARQVIYGGDLVTNLLEVTRLDEGTLTALLAESVDLPAEPPGELALPSDAARALVPVELALERTIVPVDVRGDTLLLAVAEPLGPEIKEQLAFSLGMDIEERAALAVRVLQSVSKAYGAPLDKRMQRLIAKLSGQSIAPTSSIAPRDEPSPSQAAPRAVAPSSTPRASSGSSAPTGPGAVTVPPVRRSAAPDQSAALSHSTGKTASSPSTPPFREGPARSDDRERPLAPSGMPHARGARRRRGPITFQAARREAEEALDRDGLLALFFDYARQFFEYAALFLVQGDIAEGRDGFGNGAERERVLGIGVPLDLPSLLSQARDARASVTSHGPAEGLDATLLSDLERPGDADVAVIPLVVRTRAVALLLGDFGESGIEPEVVNQVTLFCGVVSKAFERIIVRRKLEGFVAGSRGAHLAQGGAQPALAPGAVPSAPPTDDGAHDVEAADPVGAVDAVDSQVDGLLAPPSGPTPESVEGAAAPAATEDPETIGSAVEEQWFAALKRPPSPPSTPAEPGPAAVSVPPRRPPSARVPADAALPSVMVDVEGELATLVERILAGDVDEQAEAELLRQGERAVRVLMARFPGPVTFERSRFALEPQPPRASACGPLLRLLARERKVALPYVLQRVGDADPEVRGWATHLLGELPYPEALPALVENLRGSDASTRVSAAIACGAVSRVALEAVVQALTGPAQSADPIERAAAMRAYGEVRNALVVPALIGALTDGDSGVAAAASDALVRITRQDFGSDMRPWLRWWNQNSGRERMEWLIDALTHDFPEARRAAGEELRTLSRQYVGYSSDLPPRERERAQQRYRDWWATEGRLR